MFCLNRLSTQMQWRRKSSRYEKLPGGETNFDLQAYFRRVAWTFLRLWLLKLNEKENEMFFPHFCFFHFHFFDGKQKNKRENATTKIFPATK